jgi:hypothetical protein
VMIMTTRQAMPLRVMWLPHNIGSTLRMLGQATARSSRSGRELKDEAGVCRLNVDGGAVVDVEERGFCGCPSPYCT